MAAAGVVEVDDIELRFNLISFLMREQVVVGDGGEVGKLEVIDELGEALFNLLFDVGIDHGKGFAGTGSTEDDTGTEGIDYVDPAVIPLLLVVETGGQIDGIFICEQAGFLHETLVLVIEYVVEQVVLQQTAYPDTCRQQAEVADAERQYIKRCAHHKRYGQVKQPPVEKEQDKTDGQDYPYMYPFYLFFFHPFRSEAGQGKEHHTKSLV